ncbi:MAG: ester cyclase [Pseudomonadota bacterium]
MIKLMKNTAIAAMLALTPVNNALAEEPHPVVFEVYDAFQSGEIDRWDNVLHKDVVINSSASFNNQGIETAKAWANGFLTAFAPRIDLVDYINAIDADGNGRAVVTFNLNWKHVEPFFGTLQPTGREGTSVENMILTVEDGKVTRMEVADTTLDLVIYMHENGWTFPQNIRPEPIIKGVERPAAIEPIALR